jgi:hypothetical protein
LAPDHNKLYVSCPICGTIALPEAKFCHYCGTAVSARESESLVAENPSPEATTSRASDATSLPLDAIGSSLAEFSEGLDKILSDEPLLETRPEKGTQPAATICQICGQPLPAGSKECPYCQSINVNLRSDFSEDGEAAEVEAMQPVVFDSFSDLFSNDAFREIFVGGGLNLDEVSPPQPVAKQPSIKPKPILFTSEETPVLDGTNPPPNTEAIARELASTKPDISIMDFKRPRESAPASVTRWLGLPPIPWWGWAGAAFILLLILIYFVLIPLITHHEPEQLSKPAPVTTAQTTPAPAQVAPAPTVNAVPVVILLPNLPLLSEPSNDADTVGERLGMKTKADLLEETDDFVKVKLEDGREGYIARTVRGKSSYIPAADYTKRSLASPIITSPRAGQTIRNGTRKVTVRWTRVSDPEGVTYSLLAQYGDGKGTWWDLTRRSGLSGTQGSVEYPSSYPGRVMVTATTRDGVSNSSGWVTFKFAH